MGVRQMFGRGRPGQVARTLVGHLSVYSELFPTGSCSQTSSGGICRSGTRARRSASSGCCSAADPDGDLLARVPRALGGRVGIDHYTLYLLAGLATWVFFATTVQVGSRAMLDNAELIRKTRFPRQLVAFSVVGANVVTYAVMLVVLLVASFVFVPGVARRRSCSRVPLAALFVCFVAGLTLIDRVPRRRSIGTSSTRRRAPPAVVLPDAGVLDWSQFTQHETIVQIVRYGNPVSPPRSRRSATRSGRARPAPRRRRLPRLRGGRRARARRVHLQALDDRIAVEL